MRRSHPIVLGRHDRPGYRYGPSRNLLDWSNPVLRAFVCLVREPAADASFQMSLIHTQDTYGAVVAVEKNNAACAPFANGTYKAKCYGGMGRRMTYIRNAMTTEPHVLLLDTGNFLSGTSTLSFRLSFFVLPAHIPPFIVQSLFDTCFLSTRLSVGGSRRNTELGQVLQ